MRKHATKEARDEARRRAARLAADKRAEKDLLNVWRKVPDTFGIPDVGAVCQRTYGYCWANAAGIVGRALRRGWIHKVDDKLVGRKRLRQWTKSAAATVVGA
jgi:hypothetical protein